MRFWRSGGGGGESLSWCLVFLVSRLAFPLLPPIYVPISDITPPTKQQHKWDPARAPGEEKRRRGEERRREERRREGAEESVTLSET